MNKKDVGIDWKNAWLNLDEEKKIVYPIYEDTEKKEGEKDAKKLQRNRKKS